MARKIEEILTNQDLRNTIIQGGLEHTRKHFDNRELVAKLGDIFMKQQKSSLNPAC